MVRYLLTDAEVEQNGSQSCLLINFLHPLNSQTIGIIACVVGINVK